MAFENLIQHKLSHQIKGLLPEYIREEAPIFEQFLKAYFEYLESEIIVLDTQSELDTIGLEDGTGSILFEPVTTFGSEESENSKIVSELSPNNFVQSASPFEVGEYVYGFTSGSVAKIEVINGDTLYLQSISGSGFSSGERIQGRNSLQTSTIASYKENIILANSRLMDYSDIDQTTESFLQYFQKDFIPSLNLTDTSNRRKTIKNISTLYKQKGTEESLQFLMRLMYGQDAEVRYPINETIFASDSDYNQQKRISVTMSESGTAPESNDKVTQFDNQGKIIAQAIVENVYVTDTTDLTYSIHIGNSSVGEFGVGEEVTFLDRDGVTSVTATVKGIMSGLQSGLSSTYLDNGEDGHILYEDGSGLLLEQDSIGSLYRINDRINFGGGKSDDVTDSQGIVSNVTTGPVEQIFIEDAGQDYYNYFTATATGTVDDEFVYRIEHEDNTGFITFEDGDNIVTDDSILYGTSRTVRLNYTLPSTVEVGMYVTGLSIDAKVKIMSIATDRNSFRVDRPIYLPPNAIIQIGTPQLVVFEDAGTGGSGAVAYVGSVGDEIILENKDIWGQFEFTATEGQTIFNGRDNYGERLIFNDNTVEVWVDGIQRDSDDATFGYTQQNDRITFINGLSAGQQVDIYHEYNNLMLEDGSKFNLETGGGEIRSVKLVDGGYGYHTLPRCWVGGYLYFSDVSDFQVGEVVEGQTSNATATIVKIEPNANRILVKRLPTDTGKFELGESVEGNVSESPQVTTQVNVSGGTGAKLYAYSTQIGGVTGVNFQNQGTDFNEDGILAPSSTFTMLIGTPTSRLNKDIEFTGRLSGATGKVVSHDADRHILYYTELNGDFQENEVVDFNLSDTFKVFFSNPYNARGKLSGQGIVQRQLLGDKGTLSSDASNLQDSLFYQTHSYVIKVGESINRYRSVVKELVHPSGHIFFGEVAIKNNISDTAIQTQFRPTIIIHGGTEESSLLYEDGSRVLIEEYIGAPDDYLLTEEQTTVVPNAFANSQRIWEIHTKVDRFLAEDGDNLLFEDGDYIAGNGTDPYMNLINDPIVHLREAGVPEPETDPTTGLPVASSQTIVGGIQIGARTEYYDSSHRNRSKNIHIIQSHVLAGTQVGAFTHPYRVNGDGSAISTVLSLDTADNGYLVRSPERRPAIHGKIHQLANFEQETIILEDGYKIEIEYEPVIMRFENPAPTQSVEDGVIVVDNRGGGDFGDYIISEDGSHYFELEVDTFPHEEHYFHTERSYELQGDYLYYDDFDRILTEDGDALIQEYSSENALSSFVPLGSTLRSINTISGQRTFDISYYIKNEDEDGILLEDNTGGILNEECKSEGLRVQDLTELYNRYYIPEFDKRQRKRTNVTYSSYVKSVVA